ncbi:pullulanase [Paenibacillus sp. P3E]|uniref:pullulanase n=1 Tax=Paenibacillus sp. P3E TaxID=1349435 RepID=UPI00093F3F3F|nr:pullulanase [Paenibacillus sp. P3E]OKP73737.1 pullulanase [Paenibacillus sp. P3E]
MKRALWGKKAFAICMIVVFVCSYFSYPGNVKAQTSKVVLVGNLQSELSTEAAPTSDWNPDASVTQLTYVDNGMYKFTGTLPAGVYEYKIALNGTWDESYGYSSYTNPAGVNTDGNIQITLTAETSVTFYYNDLTKKIADSTYYTPLSVDKLPRLTGTLQTELGDARDSSPADAGATLSDPDFDGIYERVADLPAGEYAYRVYVPGDTPEADKLYPDQDQTLKLPADLKVTFRYNAQDHGVSASFTAPAVPGKVIPVPEGQLRIHYNRPAGDYSDQGLWLWDDVASPSAGWPTGATPFPEGQTDAYGAYADVPLKAGAKKVSFLVVNRSTQAKDKGDKLFTINTPQTNELWIKQDSDIVSPYEPVVLPANTVRVHYTREDSNQNQYGLWLWDDVASLPVTWPGDAAPFLAEHTDAYGAYADIPLKANSKKMGFVVVNRSSGDKDGGDKTFGLLDRYNQLWIKKGDDHVYVSPFGELPLSLASAEVLSTSKILLTFTLTDGLDAAGLKSAITVTDKAGTPVPVTAVTIKSTTSVEVDTGAFELDQSPLSVTYSGKSVSASAGWRMLDEMYNYTGDDLGATYHPADKSASLKLWAPMASSVVANVYSKTDAAAKVGQVSLTPGDKGVWSVELKPSDLSGAGDVRGYYYQYEVTNNGVSKQVLDPYAKSMAAFTVDTTDAAGPDGDRVGKAAIVDLSGTNPPDFKAGAIAGYQKREDAVIYEVHVRDFTSDVSIESQLGGERWGSYAAFEKKLDYIKSLGVTHIQLMPVMAWYYGDETKMGNRESAYSTQNNEYNWGYDPHSYFSPDGAYSQHPTDPEERIKELKGLIDAVHKAGMGVILDVVYTHMAKKDFLDDIVPDYYAFKDANGNFVGGFGNNLATSHKMAEKLMVDSVKYWFSEYKIDGMRWDMMGDATADAVQAAYDAAEAINPKALFIGEGWKTFAGAASDPLLTGKGADQSWMDKTDSVGVFSDEFRNELKSGYGSEGEPRFITGGARSIATIFNNIKAQPSNIPADDPGDVVPYIEAHDNLTLHDVIAQSIKKDPSIAENELEIQKRIRLGNLLELTSQGTAFLQAGQEYGRTKQWKAAGVPEQKYTELMDGNGQSFGYFIHDSYDSSDAVNHFDWAKATDEVSYPVQNTTRAYTSGLIQLRQSTDAFRLGDKSLVDSNVSLIAAPEIKATDLVIGYKNKATDGTGLYYVFMNGDNTVRTLTLSEDLTGGQVLVDNDQAGTGAIPAGSQSGFTLTANSITLAPLTAVIIRKDAAAAVLASLGTDSPSYSLQTGSTHQTAVMAKYDDGSSRKVTDNAAYISSNPQIATVTSKGLVKAVKAGAATITISYGGLTTKVTVEVTKDAVDTKRYVQITYVRKDKDYTDWNLWVWNTGVKNDQIDFTTFKDGKASVLIEVAPNATSVGFMLRKGTDWNTGKQDYPDDRVIPLTAGEAFTKVIVTSMVKELDIKPVISGPVMKDGTITFRYRDDALFRSDNLAAINAVKVKVNGTEYPMVYEAANEWFSYQLKDVQEGTYKYTFLVTRDGVTEELTDPKNTVNGESAAVYHIPAVTITALVQPEAINSNENAVVTVNAASPEDVSYVDGYMDLTALGGPGAVKLDTALMKQTVAVKDTVPAGIKTIPITLMDQYGNSHKGAAKVEVKARTYTDDRLDFDWDEARIYFALTDRFKDGDSTNNTGVDKTHLEAYHGGDFRGMIDNLDYLQKLGINTLWITPIVDNIDFNKGVDFGGTQYAYHGYWAKDFTQLDEHLGNMATFKELIEKAHDKGIKIMVDVVLNHAGYGLKAEDSYPGVTAEDKARFEGMLRTDGVSADTDPVKGELAGLPDFKTEDPAVRKTIIDWQTGWLDNARTERGDTIDYFRVDTVKHVDNTTWKAFKNALTAIDPEFKLVGEYYGGTLDNDGGNLKSGQMDGLLDFGFKNAAKDFTDGKISAVDAYLQTREAQMDNTGMMAQFLSSHDENGFLSNVVGGDKGKLKVAAALQITAKGQPVIYYGEELGRSGANAGDMSKGEFSENRGDMPWDQLSAEQGLHDHYQKLLNIRAKYSQIYSKGVRTKLAGSDELGYLAFDKQYGTEHIVTAINTKTGAVSVSLPVPFAVQAAVVDEYSGKTYTVSQDQKVTVELPGRDDGGTVILAAVPKVTPTPTPSVKPTPTPSVTPAPTATPVSTPVSSSAVVPTAVPAADTQLVSGDTLKNGKDGKVNVELASGKQAVLLPLQAAALLGSNDLVLHMNSLTITLPARVLGKIQGTLAGADAEGAQILFRAAPLQGNASSTLLAGLSKDHTAVKAASDVYEFKLNIVRKDGTLLPVTSFAEPVRLAFQIKGNPDKALLGIYYLGDGNHLEYVGGTQQGDVITAEVTHFSKYAALEINKSFLDVPAGHWAETAIKSLSAKQVISGVTAAEFKPETSVTRAEFTALLVRALGLRADGQAAFTDVKADAWYASYVSAAVRQGIVTGRSKDLFAPGAAISREEMAVMIIRALEVKQGKKMEAVNGSPAFADASSINSWAAAYVHAAAEQGLLQGRADNRFAPKASMTRAEAAQVVYRLLDK